MTDQLACSVCHTKAADLNISMQRCSKCRSRLYCGTTCQKQDWPTHRHACGKTLQWYDKFRKCSDGSLHEGQLELITWSCREQGTGWGGCASEESDALKRKFEVKFGGDEATLHKHWPQGFRWTCCGTDAGMNWGCDHHGTGSKPCTCDFCRMGKPLPNSIYNEKSASRHGLNLRRGPDPRSFNPGIASIAATGRSMMGLDL